MIEGAFLPVDLDFWTHDKSQMLITISGNRYAPGHVVCLWLWTANHRADGDLKGMSDQSIAEAAGVDLGDVSWDPPPPRVTTFTELEAWQLIEHRATYFVECLLECEFLVGDPSNYRIKNWERRNRHFHLESKRRVWREDKRTQRVTSSRPDKVSDNVQDNVRENVHHIERSERSERSEEPEKIKIPRRKSGAVRNDYPSDFEAFWQAYPDKTGKGAAYRSWVKIAPANGLVEQIMAGVEKWRQSQRWSEGFITNPATWLNQHRWQDDPPKAFQFQLEDPE